MSVNVAMNGGGVLTLGDINICDVGVNQFRFRYDSVSTPLNINAIYNNHITTLPYPNIFTSMTQADFDNIVAGDTATIEKITNEGYWLVGDFNKGGLVFFKTSTTIGYGFVRSLYDVINSYNSDVAQYLYWGDQNVPLQKTDFSTTGTTDTMLYIFDQIYLNGVINSGYCAVDYNQFFMETYHYDASQSGFVYSRNWKNNISEASLWTGGNPSAWIVANASVSPKQWILNSGSGSTPAFAMIDRYYQWWNGGDVIDIPDPNSEGGYSGPAGGEDGDFDNSSDSVPIPELPPDMLIGSGIIELYSPSMTQLNDLINFLYNSSGSIVTELKKIWTNPMESIISFGIVPFSLTTGTNQRVHFCGVDSEVSMPLVSSQYVSKNFGTKHVKKYWDNALDFSSYTKIKLWLPFIGFVNLNCDDVMGSDVTIQYNIDLLTGDCIAYVHCLRTDYFDIAYDGALYSFKGNCLTQFPITGVSYAQLYSGLMNLAQNIMAPTPMSVAGIGNAILGQKASVERSGDISANSGSLGEYTPYFVIERPVQSLAVNFKKLEGYPSNVYAKLSDVSGYVEIDTNTFRIESIPHILKEEADELISILNGGFII